jgi:VanZ family protein
LHFEFCILSAVLLPLLASALIVFGSPYAGEIRGALRSSFPDEYPWIIGGVTATGVVAAIGWAVVRLRQSQHDSSPDRAARQPLWVRYTLVIAAVAVSAGYARIVSTGNSEVDLVEAFHFVEYGLVAYLFYRHWRGRPDLSGVAFSACAGLALGIADEWVQWFVPGRVGEMHDVLLNAVAVGCGLLVSTAVHPTSSLAMPPERAPRLALGAAASGLLLAFAGFVDCVHLGYEVQDGKAGVFRSRFSTQALAEAASNRPARWQVSPPPVRGFRREDHYLSEGEWHIQQRNIALGRRDWWTALREDAILEQFYAPVLEIRGRWSAEQRSDVERNAPRSERAPYRSDAAPYPIFVISRPVFWTMALLVTAFVMGLTWRV